MTVHSCPSISVVINTHNEERRLPLALRSVQPWVDEVIVVDMESSDRTREIAEAAGARVLRHAAIGYVEPARYAGCAAARSDWVMIIDADELVPEPLSRSLRGIAAAGVVDAVRIGRRNYLLGKELRHSGWNPDRDRHLRFFRRGHVNLPTRIHEPIVATPGSRVLDLRIDEGTTLVHFNYADLADFFDRMNRYTTIEAAQDPVESRLPPYRAAGQAIREWAVRFIWHRGYKDGWRGFYLSCFMAMYRLAVHAKQSERRECGPRDEVEAHYLREAERVLSGYNRQS